MSRRHANPREVDLVRWLAGLGLNNCQISRVTGVSVPSVARWRRQAASWPRVRTRRATGPRCPLCDGRTIDEPAYAYLLGLYLGDGHIVVTKKGVYRLSIFQDAKYTRLIADCRRTMAGVRAGGREPGARHQDGAVEVYSYWKHWSCLFPQHGPGLKSKRRILLVEWQARIVARHPKALLRGLIHSDGCRVINRVNGYAYPRYLFTNHSADIRDIFCRTCDVLGVAWRRSMWHTISVARRESVAILDSFIGPKG